MTLSEYNTIIKTLEDIKNDVANSLEAIQVQFEHVNEKLNHLKDMKKTVEKLEKDIKNISARM
jgi:prefoldin subunit 5